MRSIRLVAVSAIRLLLIAGLFLAAPLTAHAAPPRVLEEGKLPNDSRLGPPRLLNDKYHPWNPPASRSAWEKEREALRDRLLVSQGLWPMPPLAPLAPVVHGKIDRDDYTIEKVIVASLPGHYVTGNLYRPKKIQGKIPGVLCPHGHWPNGRFYELAADKAKVNEIDKGAEKFLAGAQYPLQARMVHLARMGCTVFHYDMVGYADSKPIPHAGGFTDVESTLRLQQAMGLQTINSIRALDFLLSLPEVDSGRIGVTGASGGGTQTFVLGAIDPRPTVAFPAVMVSTAMQGGCVCENCCYLRIGTNNVAMAAAFAPKPMALSGANDWTIDIETKGLPELKQVYGLYGVPELVQAKAYPQFGHNYNQVAREMMYAWFNTHLKLGLPEPIVEQDFTPVPPAELSVYDASHPVPGDAADAKTLRAWLSRVSDEQYASLLPKDAAGVAEYKKVVGAAARVMIDAGVPSYDDVPGSSQILETNGKDFTMYRVTIGRRGAKEQIPVIGLVPAKFKGTTVLWFDGAGKKHLFDADGKPTAAVQKLLADSQAVFSADLFQTGEFLSEGTDSAPGPVVNDKFAGYTFGYNRPLVVERARDILSVIGAIRRYPDFTTLNLVGTGEAGLWVLLARSVAGETIKRCTADLLGFGFGKIAEANDRRMLPGGLKYGGIGGLAALAAPGELALYGTKEVPPAELAPLEKVYGAAKGKLTLSEGQLTVESAVAESLK